MDNFFSYSRFLSLEVRRQLPLDCISFACEQYFYFYNVFTLLLSYNCFSLSCIPLSSFILFCPVLLPFIENFVNTVYPCSFLNTSTQLTVSITCIWTFIFFLTLLQYSNVYLLFLVLFFLHSLLLFIKSNEKTSYSLSPFIKLINFLLIFYWNSIE